MAEATAVAEPTTAKDEGEALYRFSTWLNVGRGAEGCEDAEDGTCGNRLHFHAWLRLPNQFQHREIRDKALAAKARKVRQTRDPDSDAFAILEEEIEALARTGEASREKVTDILMSKDWWADYLRATRELQALEVEGDDEAKPVKTWAGIQEDQDRFKQLLNTPADDRPADEVAELETRLEVWNKAVDERHEEIIKPHRDELAATDISALFDLLRDLRIEGESNDAFAATYSEWEWLICTYRAEGGKRRFESIEAMHESPSEVVRALGDAFTDLERTAQEALAGNS